MEAMAKASAKRLRIAFVSILAAAALAAAMCSPAMAYEQRQDYVAWGHGYNGAQYLVIHETANPGASAYNHTLYWANNPDYAVHYVMELDGSVVYNTVPDDRLAWHVGNGNYETVGIELAHAISQEQFDSQWNEAVKWAGDYLSSRGWGIDRLLSHNECRWIWGGTDHTDPDGYFAEYGRSWSEFEAAVAAYMGGGYVPDGGHASTAPDDGSPAYVDDGFGGTYTCMADALNIRSGAGLGYWCYGDMYYYGETVELDGWYAIADGYVWGRYTSWGGSTCYVAVGRATGQVEPDDYLVKGGASVPGQSWSNSGAGWYTIGADALNIRNSPWGGVVGTYWAGETVHIDGTVWSGGMEWGYYTSWSGETRYVSMDWLY